MLLLSVCAAIAGTGCLHARKSFPAGFPLEALPPDTLPLDIWRNRGPGGTVYDVIAVRFRMGTSMADRRRAITAIKGTVVGGIRNDGGSIEGIYFLRIPDADLEAALRALSILDQFAFVRTSEFLTEAVELHDEARH